MDLLYLTQLAQRGCCISRRAQDGIELVLAAGTELPFVDGGFDMVLTSAVILHNLPKVAERIRLRGRPCSATVRRVQRRHRHQLQPLWLRHRRLVEPRRQASRWRSQGRSRPRSSRRSLSFAWPCRGCADPPGRSTRVVRPRTSGDRAASLCLRQPGGDARRPARTDRRHARCSCSAGDSTRPGSASTPAAALPRPGQLHQVWVSAWEQCRRSRSSVPPAARTRPGAWPTSLIQPIR